jgi:hypothetical protein
VRRRAESLALDLPLRGDDPTLSCRESPDTYHGVRFRVDFAWSLPGLKTYRFKVRDVEVDQPIFPPTFVSLNGTLTSEVVRLDIPVIDCAET